MKLLMYFSNLKFSHAMAAEDMLLFNSINQSDANNVHILLTGKQTERQINTGKNKSSLAKVKIVK